MSVEEELPEKCTRCYFFTPVGCWGNCALGHLRYPEKARDCKDFLSIDEKLHEILLEQGMPEKLLKKAGRYFVWNMKESAKDFAWLRRRGASEGELKGGE